MTNQQNLRNTDTESNQKQCLVFCSSKIGKQRVKEKEEKTVVAYHLGLPRGNQKRLD